MKTERYIALSIGDRVTVMGTRGYYEGRKGEIESLGTAEPPFVVYHAVLFDGEKQPIGISRDCLRPIS